MSDTLQHPNPIAQENAGASGRAAARPSCAAQESAAGESGRAVRATSAVQDEAPIAQNDNPAARESAMTGQVSMSADPLLAQRDDPVANATGEKDQERGGVSASDRAKGAAQMAGGAALAAAGVPMLVLPGPGAVAIVGGVAMASKGHRTMTGREATAAEAKLDAAADKMAEVTKEQAAKAVDKAIMEGPDLAERAAQAAPMVAGKAAVVATKGVGIAAKGIAAAARGASAAGKAGAKFAAKRRGAKRR